MAILDDAVTAEDQADDVVEDNMDVMDMIDEPAATESGGQVAVAAPPMTLDAAVMEYFAWEKEREEKRSRRKTSTASRPKRGAYVFDAAAREAVIRFLAHFGPGTLIDDLSPKSMESFQETIGSNTMDPAARLQPVKEFLRYCWKQGYTATRGSGGDAEAQNLGNFLRIKRATTVARDSSTFKHEEAQIFEMTADGLKHLQEELAQLTAEMPEAVQAVAAARDD